MAALVSTRNALVRGKVARFTLVDACGMPQITNSVYVTNGFVTVKTTKNIDAGDEIKVRIADGTIDVHEPGQVTTLNFAIEINFSRIDPAAIAMLTGDPLIMDYVPKAVGWEELALQNVTQHFGLEVWTSTSPQTCLTDQPIYGYMLYPLVGQATVEFDDITDKEVTGTIKGMSYGSPAWGKGPYGTAADGSSILGPVASAIGPPAVPGRLLVAVNANAHRHFEVTPVPPPAAFTTPGPISMTLPSIY